ncbi:sugar ABC transporter substrate-binding protein [Neobacillus sp. DY30]|uniref:ABC transporter substrate-binding protein n=1 Tax=Neobacillus sp. DY30 TaxID=3047871 RepID=UPI0024C04D55|nr:sugar ABC transporter substrate-binding protein [Neobacillus sp. DY30]WHY01899.1 sugar ABC transporter substrate-binding protein [Neobacillus sp. DY30]
MFRKKLTTSVMALTMIMGLVLTGCKSEDLLFHKSTSKKDNVIKIVFWDDNTGPQRKPIWEKLITKFEEENPTIDVEYIGLPKDSAKAMFDAAIASGETPDVASVYTSWLPEFSVRDALLPLDSYFSKWSEKDKINKGAIDFNKRMVSNQNLYGIPYTQNLDILWVRSDWFKEVNLNIPETWDEFFTAVELLTNKSDNRYGYSIRGGAGGSFQLQRMMYAYSGIETFFKDGKSTINDPKHVEFLKKYFGLYQNYTPISDITNDYKAMIAGFDSGKIAMLQHNIGSFAEHNESLDSGQFQAIPLPKSVKGNFVAEDGNTIGISIFKGTRFPEESWKFIEFINSKEAQSFWNQSVGQIPTNLDVLNEDWIRTSPHIQTAQEVYNDPATILFEPPFYLSEYRTILNTIVDTGTQSVLSGKMTVEEFLNKWAEAMEEAQKQYDEGLGKPI